MFLQKDKFQGIVCQFPFHIIFGLSNIKNSVIVTFVEVLNLKMKLNNWREILKSKFEEVKIWKMFNFIYVSYFQWHWGDAW